MLRHQPKAQAYKKYSNLPRAQLDDFLQMWKPGYENLTDKRVKAEAKRLTTRENMLSVIISTLGEYTTKGSVKYLP